MTAIPEVVARFVPTPRRHRGDAAGHLVVTCPWCGKPHRHGAGSDPARPAYGHRVAHCAEKYSRVNNRPGESRGYVLVPELAP